MRRAKLDKGMVVLLDRKRGRMKDRKSLQVELNKYIGKDVPTGRGKHGWMELRGGNEVDGDKVARLDARGGADGGENGAGQDRNTRVMMNCF